MQLRPSTLVCTNTVRAGTSYSPSFRKEPYVENNSFPQSWSSWRPRTFPVPFLPSLHHPLPKGISEKFNPKKRGFVEVFFLTCTEKSKPYTLFTSGCKSFLSDIGFSFLHVSQVILFLTFFRSQQLPGERVPLEKEKKENDI